MAGGAYGLPLPYYADPADADQDTFVVANPAVGTTVVYTPDTGYIEDIQTVQYSFFASAAVATRVPGLQLRDPDGHAIWSVNSPLSVTAGQAGIFMFARNAPSAYGVIGGVIVTFIPLGYLYPGYDLVTTCANLDAGDSFTGIALTRVRIPTRGSDAPFRAVAVVPPVLVT